MKTLFSIAYFPPVSYVLKCLETDAILIDKYEHFQKQTYRNRCCISGPNGKQSLIIPVRHENLFRTPVCEVKMELNTNWKNIHWKSIETAYRNAPYFEFYENELKPGYDFETEYLFDFNFNFFLILLSLFKIKKRIEFTEKYEAENPSVIDVRQDFHPKRQLLKITPYSQVFSERSGFINDLSAMDYLFNCGPELLKYKNS